MADQEKDELVRTLMAADGRNSEDHPLIAKYANAAVDTMLRSWFAHAYGARHYDGNGERIAQQLNGAFL
jgi:hypothetical protein